MTLTQLQPLSCIHCGRGADVSMAPSAGLFMRLAEEQTADSVLVGSDNWHTGPTVARNPSRFLGSHSL